MEIPNGLLGVVLQTAGPQILQQLAGKIGVSESQAATAVQYLMPVITNALQNNAKQQGGTVSLMGALQNGNHQQYVEDPSQLTNDETVSDGNNILGHLLGSKEVSRAKAQQVSGETGLPVDALKKALPLVAALAMGGLSKQKQQTEQASSDDDFASQLGGLLSSASESGALGNVLAGLFK